VNREWGEGVCARLANHEHFNVRGNAILGFGHLARIHARRAHSSAQRFCASGAVGLHARVSQFPSLEPLFPSSRMPMIVKNRHHFNHFVANFEVNGVWESMEQCSTYAISDFRELERRLAHTRHDYIKLHQECCTKSTTLFFVPSNRIENVEVRFVP
jgi:hypothetical protein